MTAAVYLQATLALLPVPVRFDPSALQLAGWPELAAQVEVARRLDGASFDQRRIQYGVASELAYWLPAEVQVVGIEPRWRMFDLPAAALDGRVGILVRSARREAPVGDGPWASRELLGEVGRQRGGESVELYRLYRVVGGGGLTDAVVLPRR